MRIALLAHGARSGGSVSVAENIILGLLRHLPQAQFLITYTTGSGLDNCFSALPDVAKLPWSGGDALVSRIYFDLVTIPRESRRFRPDITIGLANRVDRVGRSLTALLAHQAFLWYDRPYAYVQAGGLAEKASNYVRMAVERSLFKRSLKRCDLLWCQTQTAKTRIETTYSPKCVIRVRPNAIDRVTNRDTNSSLGQLSTWSSIPKGKKTLLYLTRYYKHKNIEILLQLVGSYRENLQDYVFVLTISPQDSKASASILRMIEADPNLRSTIHNVGYLPQHQLPAWLSCAYAMVMPTLLESFSGSYIEAMQYRVPILTSDRDFAHDVCGNAALYFDPLDPNDILRAIECLPEQRNALVQRGQDRLRSFVKDWDTVVGEMVSDLAEVSTLKGMTLDFSRKGLE